MDPGGSQEADITMPISVNYGAIHESSNLKMLAGSGLASGGGGGGGGGVVHGCPPQEEIRPNGFEVIAFKKGVKYRECLKNHAASIGGHALDGCGEFMPSGEEGSLEALKCAACNCHRNFHRREVEGEPPCYCFSPRKDRKRFAPLALPPNTPLPLPSNSGRSSHQMIMALNPNPNDGEEQQFGMMPGSLMHPSLAHPPLNPLPVMKKRFRTKFSSDQKEKMCAFAEKLGWRIQKHDEAAVQQFCSDVGVKRHVLKVWMHNNKHTVGKKMLSNEANEVGVGYLDNGGSPTNSCGLHA